MRSLDLIYQAQELPSFRSQLVYQNWRSRSHFRAGLGLGLEVGCYFFQSFNLEIFSNAAEEAQ